MVPGATSYQKLAMKQGDPEEKQGLVGAFCRTYNVLAAILIRVMDKPHQHAVICSHPKVYRERVLDGWHTVAAFRNGEEVKS